MARGPRHAIERSFVGPCEKVKFVLLTIKSNKPSWVKEGLAEYLKKIDPIQKIEMIEVAGSGAARDSSDVKKRNDSKVLLGALHPDDWVILLDEKGKNLSSIDFSKKLNQILLSGKKRAVFLIGGAYGVDQTIQDRAQLTISLSAFVMNHWVAQIVTLEQIYRGFAILKSLPYHNE